MNWKASSRFWKNVVSWLVQQNPGKGYSVKSGVEGQDGIITVRAEDDAFITVDEIKGILMDPDGIKQDIKLLPGTPGEYSGSFTNLKSGVYIADITLTGSDGRSERISTGLIMPYSPEYDLLSGNNDELIRRILYEGGGRLLDDPSQVFKSELTRVTGTTDTSFFLIAAAFVLFLLDITFRRLNLHFDVLIRKPDPVPEQGKGAAESQLHTVPVRHPAARKEKIRIKKNKERLQEDSYISQLLDKKRKWKR